MDVTTVDFETMPIVGSPLVSAPKPISVAVRWSNGEFWYAELDPQRQPGEEPQQYDPHVVKELRRIWREPTLFHNAPFDLSVAHQHLNIEFPRWDLVHDTLYMLFHNNPYGELGLKPASTEILGMDPNEQDELHNWILANVPGATKKTAGAYIYMAPLDLVCRYALSDTDRTYKLFERLAKDLYYDVTI